MSDLRCTCGRNPAADRINQQMSGAVATNTMRYAKNGCIDVADSDGCVNAHMFYIVRRRLLTERIDCLLVSEIMAVFHHLLYGCSAGNALVSAHGEDRYTTKES